MSAGSPDVPVSCFAGTVRVHDMTGSSALQDLFLWCFFPEFGRFNRARRYSGDLLSWSGKQEADLPRQRYFAVCGPDGTDRGLLRNELSAYGRTRDDPDLLLIDYRHQNEAALLSLAESPTNALLCILGASARERFRDYLREAGESEDVLRAGDLSLGAVRLSTKLQEMNVTGCLDLRLPESRSWFFERYRRGVPDLPGFGLDAADVPMRSGGLVSPGFHQMIFALTDATIGGGLATQVIGFDLRRLGVDALVFPSARSDAYAVFQDGALVDWYGWNLVDFRGAPPPAPPEASKVTMVVEGERDVVERISAATAKMVESGGPAVGV